MTTIQPGDRFGRLTIIALDRPRYWQCRCDCGGIKVIYGASLKAGLTRSCGCLKREISVKRLTTHGMSRSPEFLAWETMLKRCDNPNSPAFKYYGGRGITIDPSWRKFDQFFRDMGFRPSSKHSIDRVNNNGSYCKANCRWATRIEQANNRRNNHLVKLDGQVMTLTQAADRYSIPVKRASLRLRRGWSVEDAFTKGLWERQATAR